MIGQYDTSGFAFNSPAPYPRTFGPDLKASISVVRSGLGLRFLVVVAWGAALQPGLFSDASFRTTVLFRVRMPFLFGKCIT